MKQRIAIIDGNNLFNRGFFIAKNNGDNPIEFCIKMIANLKYNFRDCKFVFAFDTCKSKYRLELYPEYKATRKSSLTQEEYEAFIEAMKVFREIIEYAGYISLYGHEFEADDYIACLTKMVHVNSAVHIISTDNDLYQLINDNVTVYDPIKGIHIYEHSFEKITGVKPQHFLTYKCLRGDTSDNIKGIPGVGEITAKELLSKYGSFENMLLEIDKKEKKSAKEKALLENKHIFERNVKLMNLSITATDPLLKEIVKSKVRKSNLNKERLLQVLTELQLTQHFEKIISKNVQ